MLPGGVGAGGGMGVCGALRGGMYGAGVTAGRMSLACDLLDLQCLCGFLSRDVYEADGASGLELQNLDIFRHRWAL